MKVLVIGGTGFIASWVVRQLHEQGHTVSVLHRGHTATSLPETVEQILGDRNRPEQWCAAVSRLAPEVVVDFTLSSGQQAQQLVNTIRGIARRVIAISSIDVYRAFAIVNGSDTGPLQPVPLTEDSALRTTPAYPPEMLARLRHIFTWVTDDYNKIPVERTILSNSQLHGTVLRLPMVYGPGDPLHRFFPYLKRMDDGRPAILFADDYAAWRSPRGYVENVAAAVALAAASPQAAGRIYNVVEQPAFSELEWARKIAMGAGWGGELVVLPRHQAPPHLRVSANLAQHGHCSSARIRQELGFRDPVPLEEAIRRTIAWERANPPAQFEMRQFDYAAEDAVLASSADENEKAG